MKTTTKDLSRKAVLYGELAYDPNVEARYGPASRSRMAALRDKIDAALEAKAAAAKSGDDK
jgi:hypothetical protein